MTLIYVVFAVVEHREPVPLSAFYTLADAEQLRDRMSGSVHLPGVTITFCVGEAPLVNVADEVHARLTAGEQSALITRAVRRAMALGGEIPRSDDR